jgi:type VI secretion system secreted protein VgrG
MTPTRPTMDAVVQRSSRGGSDLRVAPRRGVETLARRLLYRADMAPKIPVIHHRLDVAIASGDALDIRRFHVSERMSKLFEVTIVALSENPDIDFEAAIGQPMRFAIQDGILPERNRAWTGVCSQVEQLAVEDRGLSTYQITLVPVLWLLTQRRNYRMFQTKTELEIVLQLLQEWGIEPTQLISGNYKKRKYRVQYGESDFTFICRMLEDAGISFYFDTVEGETKLVLSDGPNRNESRPPIAFRDEPTDADKEHVTEVRVNRRVRPGKYTVRDHDYRRPASYKLIASSGGNLGVVEEKLERFHYTPGAFLFESEKGDPTPNADDKGRYRTDENEAGALAQKRLEAKRAIAKKITFSTNVVDLAPGVTLSFMDHPKSDLEQNKRFLVIEAVLSGAHDSKWTTECEVITADSPYRPAMDTPKPTTRGVESATVVGPQGEEIHTDEFGRVRVHFHWDRESKMDDNSSCWIHVSQPWGGTGFGGSNLPRIGQEVIVDFLGGDPDRPIITGRVYTNLQKTPYKLPDNKTQSGWQSRSSPGGSASNYNEIMFEDKIGQELVRMQAEKDLNKLVKNDEQVKIGHDRTKQIGHDDSHDVGHDRMRTVGNDESAKVGNDEKREVGNNRSRQVGNDETVSIGNNRTKTVGKNEEISIGNNQQQTIGNNQTQTIGSNQKETIGSNQSVKIGENQSTKIGNDQDIQIGNDQSVKIGQKQSETVGVEKTLKVGDKYDITVGDKMTITVGASKMTLEQSGKITIEGTEFVFTSSGPVTMTGTKVTVNSEELILNGASQAELNGGKTKITGGPVDIN